MAILHTKIKHLLNSFTKNLYVFCKNTTFAIEYTIKYKICTHCVNTIAYAFNITLPTLYLDAFSTYS